MFAINVINIVKKKDIINIGRRKHDTLHNPGSPSGLSSSITAAETGLSRFFIDEDVSGIVPSTPPSDLVNVIIKR